MVQSESIPGNYTISTATRQQWTPRNARLLAAVVLLLILAVPSRAVAQGHGLEVSGGWAHVTQNFGTDGYNLGAAWWFSKNVTMGGEWDNTWDTSTIGNFAFTQIGAITVKSHLQNFLFGPRIFFRARAVEKHGLDPFAEVEIGGSRLTQKVQQVGMPTLSATASGFSWMGGGGVDYMLDSHWLARGRLDFLRTHLANQGQSRLRLVIEIGYTFGGREKKK